MTNPPNIPPGGTDPWNPAGDANGYGQPADPWGTTGEPMGTPGYDSFGQMAATPALASWGRRAQGWLVDWLLPNLVLNGLWRATHHVTVMDPANQSVGSSYSVSAQAPSILMFLIIAIGLAFLNKNGQTPGRRWAGTQLVNAQGQPVQAGGASVLRYLLHFLDDLCVIGWLWPLWDSKRQTFADKLAGTRVIDLRASGRAPYRA